MREWIDALRSGKRDGKHCCLGLDDATVGDLIEMNDSQKKTFDEIADFLEGLSK